jgi:hypothetical protein
MGHDRSVISYDAASFISREYWDHVSALCQSFFFSIFSACLLSMMPCFLKQNEKFPNSILYLWYGISGIELVFLVQNGMRIRGKRERIRKMLFGVQHNITLGSRKKKGKDDLHRKALHQWEKGKECVVSIPQVVHLVWSLFLSIR